MADILQGELESCKQQRCFHTLTPARQIAFKRIKAEQPKLTMTQINQLVAAEWQVLKQAKISNIAQPTTDVIDKLGSLRL
jgi:hypothetical protein